MKKIDFTGYDVVLRSAMSGETLLRSHIVAHDIARHLIELDTPLVSQMEGTHLNVLIHQATEAYLFKGTVRRIAGSDHMEIALYRGEEKSERRHERYALNLFALVQGVTRAGELLPELKRVSLRILDISAGGLRFACKDQLFQIGDRISMQLFIRGEFKFFYCEIVRYIGEPDGLHEYGCRLMTKAEYEVN